GLLVPTREPAFARQEARQRLELCAAKGRVDVRQAIVVRDCVVEVLPSMGLLSGRAQVLGLPPETGIVRDDRPAAAGRDHLVSVEAQYAHRAEAAGMPAVEGAA